MATCICKQGRQQVSLSFTHHDVPEIIEYDDIRRFRSLSGVVYSQHEGLTAVLVEVVSESSGAELNAVLFGVPEWKHS